MSPRNLSRLKLLGIALLALAPVVGSYLLYWFWEPDSHVNYGRLLEPSAIPAAELRTVEGETFQFERLRGRWVLVTLGSGACARSCEDRLWAMRQVRLAQGVNASRVERVWLIDDEHTPNARLAQDYAGTWMVPARGASLLNAFPAGESNREHVYLVDPFGNVMMRFPAPVEPKAMIKDLSRILRYSRAG